MANTGSITIELFPSGDAGAEFRVKDSPGGEVHRRHMVDRGSQLRVQADLIDIFHGTLTPGGGAGTLIIAEFRFSNMGSDKSRQFRHGEIMMKFADKQGKSDCDLEILGVAPLGTHSFNLNESSTEVAKSANFTTNFGMNKASLGATVG